MDMEIAVFLGRALFYLSLCDTIFELNVKCNLNFTQTMKVFSGVSSYIISGYSCHLLPGIESCLDKLQVIGGFLKLFRFFQLKYIMSNYCTYLLQI